MNAAELRALAERLTRIVPADLEAAAEILELIAWAEESGRIVERGDKYWWTRMDEGHSLAEETLIGLLRRAREASK